jgi:hypothetical protein
MAVYDFSKTEKEEFKTSPLPRMRYSEQDLFTEPSEQTAPLPSAPAKRGSIFSAIAARMFFVLLLGADLLWTCYSVLNLVFCVLGVTFSGGKAKALKARSDKAWISLRRSLVCGVSLFLAIFSPAFGIMIACTYFLMYDKTGIE